MSEGDSASDLASFLSVAVAIERIVFYFSCIVSGICVILVFLRRTKFPLYVLNAPVVIAIEMMVPLAVLGGGAVDAFPNVPCWVQLLTWDALLFPIATYMLASTIRLRLDYVYHRDRVLQKTNSWVVRHYRTVTNTLFVTIVSIIAGIEGWLSVLPRSFRVMEYWGSSQSSEECLNFQPIDATLDLFNGILYPILLLLGATIVLRGVREAFNLKSYLICGGGVTFFALVGYNVFNGIANGLEDENQATKFRTIAFVWYGICVHLYSWLYTVRLLWASFRFEKMQQKYFALSMDCSSDDSTELSDTDSLPPVAKTVADLKPILLRNSSGGSSSNLRQDFTDYLVSEFCCENMKYISASLAFKQLPDETARKAETVLMIQTFIVKGSLFELNISENQRKTLIAEHATSGGKIEFWDAVDNEVMVLLLEPYSRFRKRGKVRRRDTQRSSLLAVVSEQGQATIVHRKISAIAPDH